MPKIPKIIGNFLEHNFSKLFIKATITNKIYLSESLLLVRFEGEFERINFEVGQAILVRIDETQYRNYSPSLWKSDLDFFEVIFHIHQKGPGSDYLIQLPIGEVISLSVPRGSKVYKPESTKHFFFGDDTCIGFYNSLKKEIENDGHLYAGILEIEAESRVYVEERYKHIKMVEKSINPGENALKMLNSFFKQFWDDFNDATFYLMGNAKSIQLIQRKLRNQGIPKSQIITQPFWVEGKIGL